MESYILHRKFIFELNKLKFEIGMYKGLNCRSVKLHFNICILNQILTNKSKIPKKKQSLCLPPKEFEYFIHNQV